VPHDQWDLLRTDPDRIPAAIEEVLRLRPPLPQLQQVTTTDAEIAGQPVPGGAMVTLWLISANHYPRAHSHPERFDLDRGTRGAAQLSLGDGLHFCLGAPLARLETRAAPEELLRRFGRLVVERDPT
jgi:erythromycin 12 hydroxylase